MINQCTKVSCNHKIMPNHFKYIYNKSEKQKAIWVVEKRNIIVLFLKFWNTPIKHYDLKIYKLHGKQRENRSVCLSVSKRKKKKSSCELESSDEVYVKSRKSQKLNSKIKSQDRWESQKSRSQRARERERERERENLNFHKRLTFERCSTFSVADTTKMHRDKVVENSILERISS